MKRRTKQHVAPFERLRGLMMLQAIAVLCWLLLMFLIQSGHETFQRLQLLLDESAVAYTTSDFVISLAITLLLLFFLIRKRLFAPFVSILLGFLIFSGSVFFFGVELAFFLSAALILYERMSRSFLSNNVLIFAAASFGAIPFAITYGPNTFFLLLIFFSIYDVLGVFFTKLIPRLAKAAVEFNIPLLLLAPRENISWRDKTSLANSAAILGAGDLLIPAVTLGSITFFAGIPVALASLLGAIIGAVLNTILAMFIRTGIPAIPLMSAGLILAFFLTAH